MLVIGRDAVILIGTIVLHFINGDVKVRPSWTGKTATVAQMIAIGCAMLFSGTSGKTRIVGMDVAFLDLPVLMAGFFTLVSGLGYVKDGLVQLQSKGHGEPQSPGKLL